jgi:hypothetical protein
MRRRFSSDSYAADKARRLRRIARRSSAELTKAFESGQLSLRKYDLVSRGSKAQQRRVVAAQRAKHGTATLAAKAINELLDGAKAGQVRLSDVTTAITNAVREYRKSSETCSWTSSAETRTCPSLIPAWAVTVHSPLQTTQGC